MKKAIVAYIPVLHDGYKKFLEKHSDADELFIFGQKLIDTFDYLHKEIRALSPENVAKAIESWGIVKRVSILGDESIDADEIVLPVEDVCRGYAEKFLKNKKTVFDPVFLRWDRTNTKKEKKVGPERVITENEFMDSAFAVAEKSSDWWRKVGAVVIKNGKIIISHTNNYVPSPHQAYSEGDPRNASHQGEDLDKYITIHAEAGSIAEAARKGIELDGAEMYVTDFPCPVCAKQIAYSGIKKLYYTRGYAVLDGERILKSKGIEIIQVKID